MCSYMIQYSPTYANYGSLQGPFVVDNNLVRSAPREEKSSKRDSKYSQPRWCPSGLSRTKKIVAAAEARINGAQAVAMPARSLFTKQVWRPKKVIT
jgi:hypothetical protein